MIKKLMSMEILESLPLERYLEIGKDVSRINPEELDYELMRQAYTYSYFSILESEAHQLYETAMSEFLRYQSTAKVEERERRQRDKQKATDKSLEDWVSAQPEYQELLSNTIEADGRRKRIRGIVRGLEQRKDTLIQLSSNKRAESKIYH